MTPDTVVLELSDPQVRQLLDEAEQQFLAAEADLNSLEAQLQTDTLNQRSAAATVEADFQQARLEKEVNEDLAKDGLVSKLILKQSTVRADSLATRNSLEQERVKVAEANIRAQLKAQQARIDQLQVARVAAPPAGGSAARARRHARRARTGAGRSRASRWRPAPTSRASPTRPASRPNCASRKRRRATSPSARSRQVDTRNGIIPGKVIRIDPAAQNGTVTVDVALEGALPRGARPDLSVDGTVELERLDNVLYVGRPAFGQEQSTVGLFKLDPTTGEASRMQVQLGRSSVNTIEVMNGLAEGDQVVLSDMSAWDQFDRIRLR